MSQTISAKNTVLVEKCAKNMIHEKFMQNETC